MPGAYAHITAVNKAKSLARGKLSKESLYALGTWFPFAELGCVSPDYPYLGGPGQGYWADQMHYKNTATLLRSGIDAVQKLQGVERQKATSWLLGVACHMTADMTIHPIVEGIVGPYENNKAAHRLCEMHQDALIFSTLDLGDVGLTKHLNTGIASCSAPDNGLMLDLTINKVWVQMLNATYSNPEKDGGPQAKPDLWHAGFCTVLKVVGSTTKLFPFARHVAANEGLLYPELSQLNKAYTQHLKTPEWVMSYEELFEQTLANIILVWTGIDLALTSKNMAFVDGLEDWNLDTGRSVSTGKYVFWRN
jgi:hypothetical protein